MCCRWLAAYLEETEKRSDETGRLRGTQAEGETDRQLLERVFAAKERSQPFFPSLVGTCVPPRANLAKRIAVNSSLCAKRPSQHSLVVQSSLSTSGPNGAWTPLSSDGRLKPSGAEISEPRLLLWHAFLLTNYANLT